MCIFNPLSLFFYCFVSAAALTNKITPRGTKSYSISHGISVPFNKSPSECSADFGTLATAEANTGGLNQKSQELP